MRRKKFKRALFEKEMTHWQTAVTANAKLPPELHLSEYDVTRLSNGRKNPTSEQAEALATVLTCNAADLFPELTGGDS